MRVRIVLELEFSSLEGVSNIEDVRRKITEAMLFGKYADSNKELRHFYVKLATALIHGKYEVVEK